MSAMSDMSRAIRLETQKHAPTLAALPDDVLEQFETIVWAFALDLRGERERREAVPEGERQYVRRIPGVPDR